MGVALKQTESPNKDALFIDENGDFHIVLAQAKKDQQAALDAVAAEHTIVNAFTFGPVLVKDGAAQPVLTDNHMGAFSRAQRMGIGQIGPLEYICVCCEGPEDPGSQGLLLEEFGQLVASFGDVNVFYNLDGGSSSTLVFRKGSQNWAKINGSTGKKRQLKDIIYFADAWLPEE